jgi:hypothetical protein
MDTTNTAAAEIDLLALWNSITDADRAHAAAELAKIDAEAAARTAKAHRVATCTRCNGRGKIEYLRHIDGGRCWKCQF